MRGRLTLGFFWMALVLSVTLRAGEIPNETVSVIHVLPSAAPAKIEWSVADSDLGGWDVSVTFDAEHCDIYCVIRRKRDALGRTPALDLRLPPVVALRIYSDAPSEATTRIVDPAGRRSPAVTRQVTVSADLACSPGKRPLAEFREPEIEGSPVTSAPVRSLRCTAPADSALPLTLPLRT